MDLENQNQIIDNSIKQLTQIVTKSKDKTIEKFKQFFGQIASMYDAKSRQNRSKIANQKAEMEKLDELIEKQNKKIKKIMSVLADDDQNSINYSGEEKAQNFNQMNNIFRNSPVDKPIQTWNINHKFLTNDFSNIGKQKLPIVKTQQQNKLIKIEQTQRMDEQNEQQNKAVKQLKTQPKKLIQCFSDYTVYQLSYTPNLTRLKYIHYINEKTNFDEGQIKFLDNCDLKTITSVHLSGQEMGNGLFRVFSSLNWENLKALKIDKNNISDISPLKKFNLTQLQDLDVSYNPLHQQSAIFLSEQSFDHLIELAVSFQIGLDDDCWKKMLDKKMDNFPKIEVVDVGNCNLLSKTTKKAIEECLEKKTKIQMAKEPNYYTQDEGYIIKINWMVSSDELEMMNQKQLMQKRLKWERQVKLRSQPIKMLSEPFIKTFLRAQSSKGKSKGRKKKNRIVRNQIIKKEQKSVRINRGQKENADNNIFTRGI